MGAELTLLHTSTSHVARFARLGAERSPHVALRQVVREALLRRALRAGGVDEGVRRDLACELEALARPGSVVLCTCSTLGAAAEAWAAAHATGPRSDGGAPGVVRVDRAAAAHAVGLGRRVAAVVSAPTSLAPTRALLEEEARRQGHPVRVTVALADGAWERFEGGDREGYLERVASEARALARGADVVLLAQASMEGAEALVGADVPVVSSPAIGLAHAVALLEARLRTAP